jgi:hypothetical protein
MNWLLLVLLAIAATGCEHPKPEPNAAVAASQVTSLVGPSEQVSAFLAEFETAQAAKTSQIEFLGRDRLPDKRERLRYRMPEALPYREIGGLIFLAQKHGLTTRVERGDK